MPHLQFPAFAFILAALISTAMGSLKVRYTVPRYHTFELGGKTTGGSTYGNREFASSEFFSRYIEPGAWNRWADSCGFDSAALCVSSDTISPVIDTEFWVDSVFEEPSSGAYTANITSLSDSVKTGSGFIVYLFGGIRFPGSGTWIIMSGGDDGGTVASVDIDANGKFDTSETVRTETSGEDKAAIISAKLPFTDERAWTTLRHCRFENVQQGRYYRFQARYYNYSESSYSGLFWYRKGEMQARVIPSWAFGSRRNYGAPSPSITGIKICGKDVPQQQWAFLPVSCNASVEFIVSFPPVPGNPPEIIWDFGDGDTMTAKSLSIKHTYKPGMYVPMVKARWNGRFSLWNQQPISIAVKLPQK